MPTCFCTVRGCYDFGGFDSSGNPRGRSVSAGVFKTHSLDEKTKEAEDQAEVVHDDQINQISSWLSQSTLSDTISGPTSTPGGRIWGPDFSDSDIPYQLKSNPPSSKKRQQHGRSQSSPIPPSASPKASHRSREDELLSCLAVLRNEIQDFEVEVRSAVGCLRRPSSKGPPTPFPLQSYIDQSSTFQDRLDTISFAGSAVKAMKGSIEVQLHESVACLQAAKTSWDARLSKIAKIKTPSHGIFYDAAHHYTPILSGADPVLQVAFFMIVACEIVLGVSRRGCSFLLNMVQYIVNLTILRAGPRISQSDQKLLSDIPVDFRRAEEQFHLKPSCTIVAVCLDPDCHATYDPTFLGDSPVPIYPKTCTYRAFKGGSRCNTELLKPRQIQGRIVHLPIKTFVRNSFKDWLAGLLSRRGFEEKMDAAWKSRHYQNPSDENFEMSDIFDGEVLQNFNGPDGQHFSLGADEGRYVFSLCVDYFNPLGNKQAGKKKSVGLVSLVCLNLPPDLRYKPENMFLYGVIPGPNEPPLTCLNHYLKFLVDEFLEFWSPGVRFSRTSQYYYGRVVLCALVCLVCDLIGARKTAGFAGIRHNQMCAFCHCTRQLHGYGNTDVHSWRRRTNQEYRESAQCYQDAVNPKQRAEAIATSGIRWTELLRLPYFDPSRFVVVDAMHNLFLGLIQEHFEILGIKLDQHEEDAVAVNIVIPPDLLATLDPAPKKSIARLIRILQAPLNLRETTEYVSCLKKVQSCHRSALALACTSLDIHVPKPPDAPNKTKFNKMDYARALLAWRLAVPEVSQDNASTFSKGCILTEEEVKSIRSDIANMMTPSWLTSVPHDLGEPRHGKLKADQWRVLATIYLPISLVRMWDANDEQLSERSLSRHQKLLHATMSLISAVIIATSQKTSSTKADLYLQHMQSYLHIMKDLIPDYDFRPNHHMSLHLAEYLRLFGPVHAWWTFPFERLIGMLQRIPTNFKMGQLEEAITKSFIKSSNLRAMLLKDICPPAIENCRSFFTRLTHPDIRNSVLIDISLFLANPENDPENEYDKQVTVSEGTFKALRLCFNNAVPRIVRNLSFHTLEGRTFSVRSRHHGNSSILVRSNSNGSSTPAQIQEILQTSSQEVLFAVRHFRKADIHDPFAKYPFLYISLWSLDQGNTVIIRTEQVLSHFASTTISLGDTTQQYLAVASLFRDY